MPVDKSLFLSREDNTFDMDGYKAAVRADRGEAIKADLAGEMVRAGCPERYSVFTRESWEYRYGPWEMSDFSDLSNWPGIDSDPEEWLVMFYGLYGRRKTSLATAIFGECLCKGLSGKWIDMNNWIDSMQLAMDDKDEHGSVSSILAEAKSCQVLLIDDLGAVRGSRGSKSGQWWAEQVAVVLRHREMQSKPTICTTNGSIQDLEVIDRSLVSRMDVRLAFELSGPDYRQQDRENEA